MKNKYFKYIQLRNSYKNNNDTLKFYLKIPRSKVRDNGININLVH
jgi:hypothetical protein